MEIYIKNNVIDITYLSELTPAVSLCEAMRNKAAGVNSPKQLTSSTLEDFRKLWAH